MKTSWSKPVHVISFIRTLMITFAVAVCLATLMGCGNSPEKDASPAAYIETMRKAAEAGDADAQYDRGLMYAVGVNGVPKNAAEAMKWYRKAAEQGLAGAQFLLGMMYYEGDGVPQDYAEAAKWIRKAAEQGEADTQGFLGFMYAAGMGVPEDQVVAYAWVSVAVASGFDEARKLRDKIKGRLTPSQLEKGQVMARKISERIKKRKAAEAE